MRLTFCEVAAWPELAWLAECTAASGVVTIFHGRGVEVRPDWYCEAVWTGAFDDGDFDRVETTCGSGGRLRDGHITFVSSATTLDRLQVLRVGDTWLISNSLACLLRVSGARLQSSYPFYNRHLTSIQLGLDRYERRLSSSLGGIELVYYDILCWTGEDLVRLPRPSDSPDFTDFRSYRDFLTRTMTALSANAGSAGRRVRFDLLATVSSGYDSPTGAVLGQEAGCRQALCIPQGQRGADDSGRAIAEQLGLAVIVVDRDAWRTLEHVEQLAAASGYLGNVVLAGARENLRHRLLLTGYHGGAMWALSGAEPSPSIVRGDASGLGLTELRLWAGFLHCPVPFWAARQIAQVRRISHSDEMRPFLIPGSDYNRPIPRRIVEEAGIPRSAFGTRKTATDLLAWQERDFLGGPAAADYLAWLKAGRREWYRRRRLPPIRSFAVDNAVNALVVRLTPAVRRAAIAARFVSRRLPALRRVNFTPLTTLMPRQINLRRYFVPWAVERTSNRYSLPER